MGRYKKGSFTVEITILMPFILSVIIIVTFYTLYLYNRNILQNAACRGAEQVFYYENNGNEEIQEECEKVILADLEQYMLGIDEIELEVTVTASKVNVGITGKLNVPGIISMENISTHGIWDYNIQVEERRLEPAELLRKGEQIKDIFQEIGKGESGDGG